MASSVDESEMRIEANSRCMDKDEMEKMRKEKKNEKERERVENNGKAYNRLKEKLRHRAAGKNILSKNDALKYALEYIRELKQELQKSTAQRTASAGSAAAVAGCSSSSSSSSESSQCSTESGGEPNGLMPAYGAATDLVQVSFRCIRTYIANYVAAK